MNRLIKIIKDLKQNRRLSSESESIISPFIGKTYESTFSFLEASSSFAIGLSEKFKGGKTVLAEITDFGLDCSILFPKSMNEWIDGLKEGDDLEVRVRVLKFDNLYQRVVFEQHVEETSPKEKPEEYPRGITDSTKTGLIGKEKVESADEEVIETESLAENFAATESIADSLTLIHPGSKTEPDSSNQGDSTSGEELKIEEFTEQVTESPEPAIIEQDLKNENDSSEIHDQQDEIKSPIETRESFPGANEFEIWKSKYLAGDPVRKYFSEEQIIQTFRKTHSQETSLSHQVISHSESVPTEESGSLKTSKISDSDQANEFKIWKSKYLAGDPVRKYFSEEQFIQTFRKTHSQENSLTSLSHQVISHSESVPTEKSAGLKTSKNSNSDEANEFEIWKSKYLAGDPVREHFSEEQIIQTFSKTHSQEASLGVRKNYKLTRQKELKNLLLRSIKRYPFLVYPLYCAVILRFLMVGGWREGRVNIRNFNLKSWLQDDSK